MNRHRARRWLGRMGLYLSVLLLVSPFLAAAILGPVGLWTVHRRARLRPSAS